MKPIIEFLKEFTSNPEEYSEHLRATILTWLSVIIKTEKLVLKEPAGDLMKLVAQELNADDRGNYVLPIVLEMAHDEGNEENRIVAIQLLSKLAENFGPDLCEHFVGFEILSLGEDPKVTVRKECLMNLDPICKVVTPEFTAERFLPFFVKMTEDYSWVVRRACVEAIVKLSEISPKEVREGELTKRMLRFLDDSSKGVKIAAFKQLGVFISTLSNVNEQLLSFFVKMTDFSINNLGSDNEVIH
jgi:serine/threonine-protein phosphatase 4 regulatory subunit 1